LTLSDIYRSIFIIENVWKPTKFTSRVIFLTFFFHTRSILSIQKIRHDQNKMRKNVITEEK